MDEIAVGYRNLPSEKGEEGERIIWQLTKMSDSFYQSNWKILLLKNRTCDI